MQLDILGLNNFNSEILETVASAIDSQYAVIGLKTFCPEWIRLMKQSRIKEEKKNGGEEGGNSASS